MIRRSVPHIALLAVLSAAAPAAGQSDTTSDPTPQTTPAEEPDPRLAALEAEVAAHPDDDALRRRLAIALHGVGMRDEAIEQFEILSRHRPTDPQALLDVALAYSSGGRADESVAAYRKLLEVSPGHPIALHNLGNLSYKSGDAAAAADWYQKAIASKPDYLLAWYHLGDALKLGERFKDAYRAYEKVLELEPRTPEEVDAYYDSLYKLASLDLAMGAYDRARQMLEELLRADPEHGSAYYAYGQVLLRLGRPDDARRAFERHAAIQAKKAPTSPMASDE